MKRAALGALMGASLLLMSEAVRFSVDEGRAVSDALWSVWVIPFGAVMFSISGKKRNESDH